MENKIKELIKVIKLLEKLIISLISLIGWILILIEILIKFKGARRKPSSYIKIITNIFSIRNMNKLYKELTIRIITLIGLIAFLVVLVLKILEVM